MARDSQSEIPTPLADAKIILAHRPHRQTKAGIPDGLDKNDIVIAEGSLGNAVNRAADPKPDSRSRPAEPIGTRRALRSQAWPIPLAMMDWEMKTVTIEGENFEYIDSRSADRKARTLMKQLYKDSPKQAGIASLDQGLELWAKKRKKHRLLKEFTRTVSARIILMNPDYNFTLANVFDLKCKADELLKQYNL